MNRIVAAQADFRDCLRAALATTDLEARLDLLIALAGRSPDFVATLQLDKALAGVPAPIRERRAPRVRIALLSSATIDHLAPALRVAGARHGWFFEIFSGAFNQYRQEVLDDASRLGEFQPDMIVLSVSARELIAHLPVSASAEQVEHALAGEVEALGALWSAARGRFGATLVQQTCLDVFAPLFGSFDRLVPAAPPRLVARLNDLLAAAAHAAGVLLLDVAQASARDGIDAWHDAARWLQGKMEIAPQAGARYGELLARLVDAQRGRARKCLVLDLDDTLWGGVVGEVGVEGLVLGEGSARGEAALELQRYASHLVQRGIVLAVCSKNDPVLAERAFREHPEMLLRFADIAAFVANWNDKAENLAQIARQLNLGLDSLVFVDDNPAERARIRQALPMVAVPELPDDPAGHVRFLADQGYFEAVSFTTDDAGRAGQYAANAEREALRATQSLEEFLRGLQMTMAHGPVTGVDLARATQLINKTNQFNTTGRRYSGDEVAALAAQPANLVLWFRLADRLGDNGLVSVLILRPDTTTPKCLEIDTWVMSCRVFGRHLEHEIMNIAVEAARERGVEALRAGYVPTERNAVIRGLYRDLGFAPQGRATEKRECWLLATDTYSPRSTFIQRRPS